MSKYVVCLGILKFRLSVIPGFLISLFIVSAINMNLKKSKIVSNSKFKLLKVGPKFSCKVAVAFYQAQSFPGFRFQYSVLECVSL